MCGRHHAGHGAGGAQHHGAICLAQATVSPRSAQSHAHAHSHGGTVRRRTRVLTAETEFQDGHENADQQAANQDVENAGHVAQREFVVGGLAVLVGAALCFVVPPFVAQLDQLAVLLQLQHRQIDGVPVDRNGKQNG